MVFSGMETDEENAKGSSRLKQPRSLSPPRNSLAPVSLWQTAENMNLETSRDRIAETLAETRRDNLPPGGPL
jgi:hypothetical protein